LIFSMFLKPSGLSSNISPRKPTKAKTLTHSFSIFQNLASQASTNSV
jgi:hypothetical protein